MRSRFSKRASKEETVDVQTAVRMLITRLQETGKISGLAPDQISRSQLSDLMENLTQSESGTTKSVFSQIKTSPEPVSSFVEITLTTYASREKNEPILLTSTVLGRSIAPYINAISTIQYVFNEVKGLPLTKIPILEIRTQPELTIRLGREVSEAIFVIKGIVNTWRQRHNAQITRYSTGNMNNRVEKTNLERSKVEMASQMLELIKAGMSEKEKFTYLSGLMPSVDVLIFSEYEIK